MDNTYIVGGAVAAFAAYFLGYAIGKKEAPKERIVKHIIKPMQPVNQLNMNNENAIGGGFHNWPSPLDANLISAYLHEEDAHRGGRTNIAGIGGNYYYEGVPQSMRLGENNYYTGRRKY